MLHEGKMEKRLVQRRAVASITLLNSISRRAAGSPSPARRRRAVVRSAAPPAARGRGRRGGRRASRAGSTLRRRNLLVRLIVWHVTLHVLPSRPPKCTGRARLFSSLWWKAVATQSSDQKRMSCFRTGLRDRFARPGTGVAAWASYADSAASRGGPLARRGEVEARATKGPRVTLRVEPNATVAG